MNEVKSPPVIFSEYEKTYNAFDSLNVGAAYSEGPTQVFDVYMSAIHMRRINNNTTHGDFESL